MRELVDGKVSGPTFARRWLAARRRVLDDGEGVRDPFERVLLDVFYSLDDYVIDASLRGPGDMTDEDLAEVVRAVLEKIDSL